MKLDREVRVGNKMETGEFSSGGYVVAEGGTRGEKRGRVELNDSRK